MHFSYEVAFSRNIGWLTPVEQQELRSEIVAIAGMCSVSGVQLLHAPAVWGSGVHAEDV